MKVTALDSHTHLLASTLQFVKNALNKVPISYRLPAIRSEMMNVSRWASPLISERIAGKRYNALPPVAGGNRLPASGPPGFRSASSEPPCHEHF